MQLTPWRPFQDMDDVFGRYARMLNKAFPSPGDEGGSSAAWAPSADISENKKEYTIRAELPEVEKNDIHVTVKNGALTIEGERKHQEEEEGETFHRIESMYGRFSRSFVLPSNVDESKIKADCKDGVLRVHLPKSNESESTGATKIEIA